MARVEGSTFTDRVSVFFKGRRGNLVIYREGGRWDGRPTGGKVVGSSFRNGTIDVIISDGTAVELTPQILEEHGTSWRLTEADIGCRLIIPRLPGEPSSGVVVRMPGSWVW